MGINRSPWLWGARKTAAGMTNRSSNGIQIYQGKRAPGQSNPSDQYLGSQAAARLIWPLFHQASGFIRNNIYSIPTGQYAANVFYSKNYRDALDFTDPLAPVLQVANLIYANGTMTPTSPLTAVADVSANSLVVTWPTTLADASQLPNDGMWLVARNRNNGHTISGSVGVRSDGTSGTVDVTALNMVVGNNIDVYFSANNNGVATPATEGSESRYITTVAVA